MSLEKKVCLSLLITLFFCLPFALLKENRSKVLNLERQSETVPTVTARVGEYQIGLLSGWASPYAEINLSGQGTARKTLADESGYFEFLFVPVKKSYGELCLTSQDVNLIPTLPVCLPAIPPTDNIEVIGVLLPPTISLEKGKILLGESTKASGMTFPNSELDVYLFENKKGLFGKETPRSTARSLLAVVYAMGLPKYSIRSNKNGYYEFSLPATQPSKNRLFATAKPTLPSLDREVIFYSPKSNTLVFSVVKTNYLWLLLILPIILILLILLRKKKNRALMIIAKPTLPSPAFRQTGKREGFI